MKFKLYLELVIDMYLIKKKFHKIKYRFLVVLLIIFSLSIIIINLLVNKQVTKNYEKQIQEEITNEKVNAQFYARQLLVTRELNNNEDGLRTIAEELSEEMKKYGGSHYEVYSLEGSLISNKKIKNKYKKDLENIIKGKESISFITIGSSKLFVNASFYITVQDVKIGIIRYNKDYSTFKIQANSVTNTFLYVSIIVFIMIFIITQYMINKMLKPIINLSEHSNEVASHIPKDNFDNISVNSVYKIERNDEIGQLAHNYNQMLLKIKEQFTLIKEDRNNILKLYEYRQDFYNNVTHELKTPLTTIKGYAEILKSNGFTDEEFFYKGIDHIINESQRLHKMVIQLLEMSNMELTNEFEKINFNELVILVVEAMNLKAKRYGNELVFNNKEIFYINGKVDSIKELIINLIDNAIKYGKENSPILINLLGNDNRVVFEIINEGVGIPKEHQNSLFKPYYRVNKEKSRELGSTGLGLAICKKIVENHNGCIYLESDVNNNTKFIVEFNRRKS